MGPFHNSYGVMGVFHCRKHPPVNRVSQVALFDLYPAEPETVNRSCKSQLALFTTNQQREVRPAVAFFKASAHRARSSAAACPLSGAASLRGLVMAYRQRPNRGRSPFSFQFTT
jgi:hypothetical protein